MNEQAERVHAHLKSLAARSFALLNDLDARRELLKEYFDADASIAHYTAQIDAVDAGGVPGEWVRSSGSNPDHRMLYVHGGSWVSGEAAMYRPMLSKLSELTGLSILAIDYKLAPENPFPAGLNDVYNAYLWMTSNGPNGASAATKTFINGDSAGGNLTLACLHKLKDEGESLPTAAIALSPATDFTGGSPSLVSRLARDPIINPVALTVLDPVYVRGAVPLDHPYVSPLFGDFRELPPILLQVGDAEVLLDDSVRLAERAKQQGCDVTLQVWDDMPHVFHGYTPFLPEAVEAIEKMAAFVKRI